MSTEQKQTSSKPKRNAKAKSQKNSAARESGRKTNVPGTVMVPHYLKLSPHYLQWKRQAQKLGEVLKPYGMSISELGKGIAEYSAKGATFAVERELVGEYAVYEKLRTAWEGFRDSFRSQADALGVPLGVAARILAGESGNPTQLATPPANYAAVAAHSDAKDKE